MQLNTADKDFETKMSKWKRMKERLEIGLKMKWLIKVYNKKCVYFVNDLIEKQNRERGTQKEY